MSIAALLSPDCILMDVQEKRKKRVIAELTDRLERTGKIENGKLLAEMVMKREAMASTGIGHGIAIPHCLFPQLRQTVIAIGRSGPGIPFDSADNKPARLIFLLAGPPDSTPEHLKLLSKLSRLLTEKDFRASLISAENPEEVIELFRRAEES